jgi:hypothetical protein
MRADDREYSDGTETAYDERPPRPWRVDQQGFKRRVRQQIIRRWLWVTVWEVLGWALILAAVISVSVCVRLALGQVPAQDKRSVDTWESAAKAQRDVYGTARAVKPGLKVYCTAGSQKCYLIYKGVDPKTGKVVEKRVVFINRQQALEWGRKNGEKLSFVRK